MSAEINLPNAPFVYDLFKNANNGIPFIPLNVEGSPFKLKKQNLLFQKFDALDDTSKDAVKEFPPHVHPDASEILVCLSGQVRGAIYGVNPDTPFDMNVDVQPIKAEFTLNPGEIAYLPQGYPHFVTNNLEDKPSEVLLCFDNAKPDLIFIDEAAKFLNPLQAPVAV